LQMHSHTVNMGENSEQNCCNIKLTARKLLWLIIRCL